MSPSVVVVVSSNVSGRRLAQFVNRHQKVIDSPSLCPGGYLIVYGGHFDSEEGGSTANLVLYACAVVVIGCADGHVGCTITPGNDRHPHQPCRWPRGRGLARHPAEWRCAFSVASLIGSSPCSVVGGSQWPASWFANYTPFHAQGN